jgi:hypothetical protein
MDRPLQVNEVTYVQEILHSSGNTKDVKNVKLFCYFHYFIILKIMDFTHFWILPQYPSE